MSTPPSLQHSSRSSTGAISQQPTLTRNPHSTQSSSPKSVSSPVSTPNSTPASATGGKSAFERALAKRYPHHPGASLPTGNAPAVGSAANQGASSSGTPAPASSTSTSSGVILSAFRKFKARLSGPELESFEHTTADDLRQQILDIQREQDRSRTMVNIRRIEGCIEAMDQFGKVIEVFLNAHQVVAFVWGPMKFLLLTASTFSEHFEVLLDAYEQIGDQMPLLKRYEKLFSKDDQLKGALELMYVDILNFHANALKFFRSKLWSKFFRSVWKNFDTQFKGILKSLGRHKNFVENCAQLAQCQLYQDDIAELQRASAARFHQYEKDITDLKAKLDEAVAEEQRKKTRVVTQWLAAGRQSQDDHEAYQRIRAEYSNTAHWIVEHVRIKEWMESDVSPNSVMWINGIPGAGKTILASAIIDKCEHMAKSPTAFFYCHDGDHTSNSAVSVLKGITEQLLRQNPQVLPHCHTRCTSSGEPVLKSLSQAQKVLEDICTIIPKMTIVVDGLDECEQAERKEIMDVLMNIAGQCDSADPGKFRLLFISQNFADIKRGLCNPSQSRPVAGILQISDTDNQGDISAFVATWVAKIATKYELVDVDAIQYIQRLTVHNAKGMFLYAKLVLENLHAQPTREKFIEAARDDNFPVGLEGAYERTIRFMKDASLPTEWEMAKKLLGWMICAKRRLTWKEIQVALSIDVDEQTIEYDDRRLRNDIHDICGSLVLLNGDRVFLVHSTARLYITTVVDDIHEPSIECELATLCLRYLTFPCFDVDADHDQKELREWALEGHFAFQDYAVAKWFSHVNAFVSSGSKFLCDAVSREAYLEGMLVALEDFMALYSDADWDRTVVEDCRANCSAFQGLRVYDSLVSLTSHIYTVQKKGFDARHEISIKSLALAFERNRGILEKIPTTKPISTDDLVRYCKFHDHERLYKCTKITCRYFSEGFKDSKARKKHVDIHERPFHCEVPDCLGGDGFVNKGDLQRHLRAFHPEMSDLADSFNSVTKPQAKSNYACTICGKTFTRAFALKNHENSHRGVRPYKCAECPKAFVRHNDLVRHQKLHERA